MFLSTFFLQLSASAEDESAQKFDLDTTMGAAFIGMTIAAILYGISIIQTYQYFSNPGQNDRWHIKSVVAAVICFDTIHHFLITHTMYTYLVSNYNNPLILGKCIWSLLAEVLFNGLTGFLVQSFLTLRVWKLSKTNWLITGIAVVLVLAEFGCICAFGIMALVRVTTFADLASMKWLSILVNALAAAGDVYIAAVLCWLLHSSRTGFRRSDTIIKKLILFTVNTGALTSLCAVASLISITAAPNTFIYISFFFCIGRLYANSLLATLNARGSIRESADELPDYNTTHGIGGFGFKGPAGSGSGSFASRRGGERPNGISIQINKTQEFRRDVSPIPEKSSVDELEMIPVRHDHDSDSGGTIRKLSYDIV